VKRTLRGCMPVARLLAMVATVAPLLTCTERSPTQPEVAIHFQIVVTSQEVSERDQEKVPSMRTWDVPLLPGRLEER
jgi:hypothetical protein